MKKLMIAAAVAAMVGGASAADALKAQVYDFTATLKTTACSGKSAKDVCGTEVQYRIQKTQKLYGKFWGCHCQVIACPANYGESKEVQAVTDNDQSYIFWTNAKDEDGAFHNAAWNWTLLQRLGKKGDNVEGAFTLDLEDCAGTTVATLAGAGYGTAKIACDESDYIKSMSGNIVGSWNVTSEPLMADCAYCGDPTACSVFAFCDYGTCSDLSDPTLAVAFGSFTIKYNVSQSKSVNGGKYVDDIAFKNNKAVLAEFACIEAGSVTPEETTVEKLEKAYAEAKTAYETATNELAEAEAAQKAVATYADVLKKDWEDAQTKMNNSEKAVKAGSDEFKAVDEAEGAATITTAFATYKTDKIAEIDAEYRMNLAEKYGTSAAYKAAKADYESATKTAYISTTNYTKVCETVLANQIATDKAKTQKAIDALNAALDTFVDDHKDCYDAYNAKCVWGGTYNATDKIVGADGKTAATEDELKKIEGTKQYETAKTGADVTAKSDAAEAAEKKMDNAKIACDVAGGDCK